MKMSGDKNLKIDYVKITNAVSNISSIMGAGDMVADYEGLINTFVESKGKEADAIENLLIAEKDLVRELGETLTEFAKSIQTVVNEFEKLDQVSTRSMGRGGGASSSGGSGFSGGGTGGGMR